MDEMPTWVGQGLVALLVGALIPYWLKTLDNVKDRRQKIRELHMDRLASIIELSTLLTTSRIIFITQNKMAQKLVLPLMKQHGDKILDGMSINEILAKLYPKFTEDQIAQHKNIRAWSIHLMMPINQEIINWLENDTLFRTTYISAKDSTKRLLANKLIELHAHLLLWKGKYNALIPEENSNAIVYLADEERHGIGFPGGLDELIQKMMTELKKNAPTLPVIKNKPE